MKRIHIILFLYMTVFFMACGNQIPKKNASIQVGVLKGPTAMSLIGLLDEPPLLEENGKKYRVTFTVKANPKLLQAELLQKKPDIAVIPTTMAAVLYNRGLPYHAAAIPVWGTLALVGKSQVNQASASTAFAWGTLKGKEIHLMGKGMTPDILFRFLLEKQGLLDQVTVNYRFPAPQDLAQAVAAGVVELAVLSEPMVSITMARNNDITLLANLTQEWQLMQHNNIPIPQTVMIVKSTFADQHRKLVNDFLDHYRMAVHDVNRNPQKAAKSMVAHGLVPDVSIGVAAIPRCHLHFRLVKDVKETINDYLNLFFQMNPAIVGGRLPDEGFYYNP